MEKRKEKKKCETMLVGDKEIIISPTEAGNLKELRAHLAAPMRRVNVITGVALPMRGKKAPLVFKRHRSED